MNEKKNNHKNPESDELAEQYLLWLVACEFVESGVVPGWNSKPV